MSEEAARWLERDKARMKEAKVAKQQAAQRGTDGESERRRQAAEEMADVKKELERAEEAVTRQCKLQAEAELLRSQLRLRLQFFLLGRIKMQAHAHAQV